MKQLQRLVKIFFGAFGAWYFLCFLGRVAVPPQGGGVIAKGGGGLQGGYKVLHDTNAAVEGESGADVTERVSV